jgi:hypothetical protein
MTRAADLAKLIAGGSTLGGTGELVLKDVDTADGSSPKLTFQTGDTDIAADDVLGTIDFQAPDEGTGTDAILVSAGVEAKAEGDFSSSSNATSLTFKTGSSAAAAERMRIDSSGNVLVAKSSANATDVGIVANASGRLFATASGESSIFNRTSSDGDILDLRKDGTSEGAIAVASDELKIFATKSSTNCGFGFYSNNTIRPVGNDGAEADNEVSLGHSSNRFKDLYLSGGLYVGGTGSANYLDDYEEGTFTATCGNSVTLTSTNDLLSYTKIGRMVHVYGGVQVNDSNSSADFNIQNLPFTCANTSEQSFQNVGITRPYLWNVASDCIQLICFAANGTTVLYFTEIKDNAAEAATDADASAYMNFSIWYESA